MSFKYQKSAKHSALHQRNTSSFIDYPTSHGQRSLWLSHQLDPNDPSYNNVHAVRIPIELDFDAFQRAIQKIVNRHASLRTTFHMTNGEPVQRIHDQHTFRFRAQDASFWSAEELEREIRREVFRPFDLETGPLLRIFVYSRSNTDHVGLMVMHHIVTDLWSLAIFIHELGAFYTEEIGGEPFKMKPIRKPIFDVIAKENKNLENGVAEHDWAYWKKHLAGDLPQLNLPTDRPRTLHTSPKGRSKIITFDPHVVERLSQIAAQENSSLFAVIFTAYNILLHRYTGQSDIIVGTPRANRSIQASRLIGYFVNPLPIRSNLEGTPSFIELLKETTGRIESGLEHGSYPYSLILENLQQGGDIGKSTLFQTMFAWQKTNRLIDAKTLSAFTLNESGTEMQVGELLLESLHIKDWISPFDITLLIAEAEEGIRGTLEYCTDLFDGSTIERMINHFQNLLANIADSPEREISKFGLLSPGELEERRARWNGAPMPTDTPSRDHLVHQIIEGRAAQYPQRTALLADNQSFSYEAVNTSANRIAHQLISLGIGPNKVVALYTERHPLSIISFLAILKAGGTYLPLDSAMPAERVNMILAESGAEILITQADLEANLVDFSGPILHLEQLEQATSENSGENPKISIHPEHNAYIICTSGSTGKPKGVLISHRAIVDHSRTFVNHYDLTPQDRVLQFASLSFDQSIEQILPPLAAGACIVMRGPKIWTPGRFLQFIAQEKLTIINLPPAYWAQVVELQAQAERDHGQEESLPHLRMVIVGGDVIPQTAIQKWFRLKQAESTCLLNAYGPSETTITALTHEIPAEVATMELPVIPIGRQPAGRKLYILDRYGEQVPTGVEGELHIGGASVGSGYLGLPAKTAEKFIPDRFSKTPGARLYRTGDLAYYRPDGTVVFAGRLDHQVKIRGFRIELGEIEHTLRQKKEIEEVVVIAWQGHTGREKELIAYMKRNPARTISEKELRAYCKKRLPHYMVPAHFISLESMPLNTSGKINRRALPNPEKYISGQNREHADPTNPIEAILLKLWKETFGFNGFGIYADFFELGGHSLLATRLIAKVEAEFDIDLPLQALFEGPTISELSQTITRKLMQETPITELITMLDDVEQAAEAEVDELLSEFVEMKVDMRAEQQSFTASFNKMRIEMADMVTELQRDFRL